MRNVPLAYRQIQQWQRDHWKGLVLSTKVVLSRLYSRLPLLSKLKWPYESNAHYCMKLDNA